MSTENYKLKQSQYARIYGVTERSIRTYQGEGLPLDNIGSTLLSLMNRKTRPPGLNSPEQARLHYEREAGNPSGATPARLERLDSLIMGFWHSHNAIVAFMREYNLPGEDDVCTVLADTSAKVNKIRAFLGISDRPDDPGEDDI